MSHHRISHARHLGAALAAIVFGVLATTAFPAAAQARPLCDVHSPTGWIQGTARFGDPRCDWTYGDDIP